MRINHHATSPITPPRRVHARDTTVEAVESVAELVVIKADDVQDLGC